ncbi:hypothetical protein PROFUN_09648 [Planoprotostelium fungivorum]|uniref:separase n=1 Tax=Planoprotostelium fungivorum TaxID=1890364 RepID=A0A2P6MNW9_9EUKA|nr:hypothetical protein PROFUN_09648 [Planoprotostelium fungivorum]
MTKDEGQHLLQSFSDLSKWKGREEDIQESFDDYFQDMIEWENVPGSRKKTDIDKEQKMAARFGKTLTDLIAQNLSKMDATMSPALFPFFVRCTESAIDLLEKISSQLKCPSLYYEKTSYKILSACYSAKQYKLTTEQAKVVEKRLNDHQVKTYKLNKEKTFLPCGKETEEFCALTVNTLVTLVTCLVELDEDVEQIVQSQLMPWIEYYAKKSSEKCMQCCDSLLRTFYRWSRKVKEGEVETLARVAAAIVHRKFEEFPSSYCDNLYKAASYFEAICVNNGAIKERLALNFYQEAFTYSDREKSKLPTGKLSYIRALNHYASLYYKTGRFSEARRIYEFAVDYTEDNRYHNGSFYISLAAVNLQENKKIETRLSEFSKNFRAGYDVLREAVKEIPMDVIKSTTDEEPENYGIFMRTVRKLFEIRRVHLTMKNVPEVQKNTKVTKIIEEATQLMSQMIETGQSWDNALKLYSKAGGFIAMNSVRLNALCTTGTVKDNSDNLREAEACAKKSGGNDLGRVAVGYYEAALRLYRASEFENCIRELEQCCRIFNEWIDRDVTRLKSSDLFRKYELIAVCQQRLGDHQAALVAIRHSIQRHPDLNDVSVNALVERWCRDRAAYFGKKKKEGREDISDMSLKDVLEAIKFPVKLSTSLIGTILENEYTFCCQLPSTLHTPRFLLSLLSTLSSIYNDGRLPLPRACILRERARVIRLNDPDNEHRPNPTAALEILSEAMEIMEGVVEAGADKKNSKKSTEGYEEIVEELEETLKRGKKEEKKVEQLLNKAMAATFFNHQEIEEQMERRQRLKELCLQHLPQHPYLKQSVSCMEQEKKLIDDMASTHLWVGILSYEAEHKYDSDHFKRGLSLYNELYVQMEGEDGEERFRCLSSTLSTLKTTADFLYFVQDYPLQMQALRFIVALCLNVKPDSLQSMCDLTFAYVRMSETYLRLGYTKRAEIFSEKSTEISKKMKEASCSGMMKITVENRNTEVEILRGWLLLESEDTATALQLADEVLDHLQASTPGPLVNLQLASAYALRSECFYNEPQLISSLSDALESFSLLRNLLTFFCADGSEERSCVLYVSDLQWNLRQRLLDAHGRVCHLYTLLGDDLRALQFSMKGHETAVEFSGEDSAAVNTMRVMRSDLLFKMKRDKEAASLFDTCTQWGEEIESATSQHAADLFLISLGLSEFDGVLRDREGEEKEERGTEILDRTEMLLTRLSSAKSLDLLENSSLTSDHLPKTMRQRLKILKRVEYDLSEIFSETCTLPAKKGKTSTLPTSERRGIAKMTERITLRRGMMGLLGGDHEEYQGILEASLESGLLGLPDRALCHFVLGKIFVSNGEEELSQEIDSLWFPGKSKKSSVVEPSVFLEQARRNFFESFRLAERLRLPHLTSEAGKMITVLYGPHCPVVDETDDDVINSSIIYSNLSMGMTYGNQYEAIRLQRQRNREKKEKGEKKGNAEESALSDLVSSMSIREEEELWEMQSPIYNDSHHDELINDLPETWGVVSVRLVEEEKCLLITRSTPNRETVSVRISMMEDSTIYNGASPVDFDDISKFPGIGEPEEISDEYDSESTTEFREGNNWSQIYQRFFHLMDCSRQTQTKKEIDSNKWATWWKSREWLDGQMKSLVESMENSILGCFRSMMIGEVSGKAGATLNGCVSRLKKSTEALVKSSGFTLEEQMIQFILHSLPQLIVNDETEEEDRYRVLRCALGYLLRWHPADLTAKKKKQLEELCGEYEREYCRSMVKSGIFEEDTTEISSEHSPLQRDPIILVLDKRVQSLPWESLDCLADTPLTRLPSLLFLNKRRVTRVDPKRCYYLLNPGKDLPSTQKNFQETFEGQETWRGVTGVEPSGEEMKRGLSDNQLFLYLGHNGGEMYLPGEHIAKMDKPSPVSLLLGCSSGRLKERGEFEPQGNVLHYLLNGCPAVVGCLWDVTDGDLDRFSGSLLYNWFSGDQPNLSEAVSGDPLGPLNVLTSTVSRSSCSMKYIVGSSPVVYGLPTSLLPFHCRNIQRLKQVSTSNKDKKSVETKKTEKVDKIEKVDKKTMIWEDEPDVPTKPEAARKKATKRK